MADYDQIKADIPLWLEDDGSELSAVLDKIIDLAELRLSRDLDLPEQTVHSTATLASGDANPYLLTIPAAVVTVRHVKTTAGRNLEQRSVEWINEVYPDRTTTGTPAYYAWWGKDTLIVAPTPGTDTGLEMSYKKRIPALSDSNTTNIFTESYYDLLLYACCVEAEAFNKNYAAPQGDGQGQAWEARYQQALETARREQRALWVDENHAGKGLR